jgi:hypothetical protein
MSFTCVDCEKYRDRDRCPCESCARRFPECSYTCSNFRVHVCYRFEGKRVVYNDKLLNEGVGKSDISRS